MRLFEVADRFVDDLMLILRNQGGRGDSKHAPVHLTYPAISNLLKPMGYGDLSFDEFSRIYDSNPELQQIIQDFNENEVVLGTKDGANIAQGQMQVPTGPSVDQMASSGAQSHLDNMS